MLDTGWLIRVAAVGRKTRPLPPPESRPPERKRQMPDNAVPLEIRMAGPEVVAAWRDPRGVLAELARARAEAEARQRWIGSLADWCDVLAQIVHEERGNVLAVREGMAAAQEARMRFGVSAGPVASDARARVADTGEQS